MFEFAIRPPADQDCGDAQDLLIRLALAGADEDPIPAREE